MAPRLVYPNRHLLNLVSRKPRGSAPGLTHPDLQSVAIRATVKKPCVTADGALDPHGLFSGIPPRGVCPYGWVNPGPTAPGLIVTNPSPSGRAQQQLSGPTSRTRTGGPTPGPWPGAHHNQPPPWPAGHSTTGESSLTPARPRGWSTQTDTSG